MTPRGLVNGLRLSGVVTLVPDPVLRERIRVTLAAHCPVFSARDCAECLEVVRRERVTCAVVDVASAAELGVASIIRGVRARAPDARIIAYGCPEQALAASLVEAARAGVDDLVFRGDRDMAALRASVLQAARVTEPGIGELLARVSPEIPSPLRALLGVCVPRVTASGGVASLAAVLRSHRNTIAARLSSAGGPTPERFRAWCLLLRVGHLLDETPWSVEHIAFRLEFSSASALSHLVSRYLHSTARTLRRVGAVPCVVEQFAAECARLDRRGGNR